MNKLRIIFLLVLSINHYSLANGFYEDRERGYYAYEEIEIEEEKIEKNEMTEKPMSAVETLRAEGEEMEELFAEMQLNPTKENIHAYIKKSREITNRSFTASMAYGDEMFFTEGLSNRPKGQYAPTVSIAHDEEEIGITNKIIAHNKKYSLIYFLRSDCPYCAQFSPILKRIVEETDFNVLAVSLDGKGMADFPEVVYSKRLIEKSKVQAVPAVYLLDPVENKVQAVSFGFKGRSDFRNQLSKAFDYIERMKKEA